MNAFWWVVGEIYPLRETLTEHFDVNSTKTKVTNGQTERRKLYTPRHKHVILFSIDISWFSILTDETERHCWIMYSYVRLGQKTLRSFAHQQAELDILSFKKTYKWAMETRGPKSNTSELLCLSWLPAALMMIRSKINELAWRHHFPIISLLEFFIPQWQLTP